MAIFTKSLLLLLITTSFLSFSYAQTNSSSLSNVTNSTSQLPVTTTTIPTTTALPKKPAIKAGADNCAADGTTSAVFANCGYQLNISSDLFELKTCPKVSEWPNCQFEEYGIRNCMLCITSKITNKDVKKGHVELISAPIIEETGPQCQVRVRVMSEGSQDIGLWKVVVRKQNEPDRLIASLLGSYQGELDLVAQVPRLKNANIVVYAEQWSNYTGRKAIGSISFEFCKQYKLLNDDGNKFRCANGRNISMASVCDFVDDCGDSTDEKPETAGCGHRTEHCMFPKSCQITNGWNPIDGRIIPHLGTVKDMLDGFLPPTPSIATGANLPGITDHENPNGLPLIVDLTSKMAQADDTFIFRLPEIDAIRDLNDHQTRCWLRFYYYIPPGLQINFDVLDSAQSFTSYLAQNLQAVASSGWVREQIELELFHHHLAPNLSNDDTSSQKHRVEFYKPTIRIQYKDKNYFNPIMNVSVNGFVGFWGLSYSLGCRPVHTYCQQTSLADRPIGIGCRRDELACASSKPVDMSQIVDIMLAPKDGSHAKDFCYPPSKKCDFSCDCHDCSDEANCGSNCTFNSMQSCGWATGDNWLWPRKEKSICNGLSCIITVPDSIYRFFAARDALLKERTLLSNMYEWMNPKDCILTFKYRLWPGTGLSVVYLGPKYDVHWLWFDKNPLNSTALTGWQIGTINFTDKNFTLVKFQIGFMPESSAPSSNMMVGDNVNDVENSYREDPTMANYPVGLADIEFSQQCGAPTVNSTTNCPPSSAVCQLGSSAAECNSLIHEPLRVCRRELKSCDHDESAMANLTRIIKQVMPLDACYWRQPSLVPASKPELSSTEIFHFDVTKTAQHCNRGTCHIVIRYDLHDNQLPSAYLALVVEETGVISSIPKNNDMVTRRQRIWQFSAADHNVAAKDKLNDYLARIPFNYCPVDLFNDTITRRVSVQFEGTSGDEKLEIKIISVEVTSDCFTHAGVENGYEAVCQTGYVRCRSDKRCYPKHYICGSHAQHASLGDLCPGDIEGSDNGFELSASSMCPIKLNKEGEIGDKTIEWSGAKILGIIVAALASITIVVLASYTVTIRVIKWYRSGGGHRLASFQNNSEQNGGVTTAFSRNDGHHFRQLVGVDNSTQMMLDMLVTDEESNW